MNILSGALVENISHNFQCLPDLFVSGIPRGPNVSFDWHRSSDTDVPHDAIDNDALKTENYG